MARPAMSQKPARLHHYLPRFYLSGFTDSDGVLATFDRRLNRYVSQPVPVTGAERGFYDVPVPDSRDSIEKLLAQRVEAPAATPVKALIERRQLTDDAREHCAVFLASLFLRTPGFRKMHDSMLEDGLKTIARRSVGDVAAATRLIAEMQASGEDVSGLTPEGLVSAMDPSTYRLEVPQERSIVTMLEALVPIARVLIESQWSVVHRQECDDPFVTSDEPFLLVPPTSRPTIYGVGIGMPNVVKVVPLASSAALFMSGLQKDGSIDHRTDDGQMVTAVNTLVADGAQRFLFAQSEATIRRLVVTTGIDRRSPLRRGVVT